MKPKQQQQQEQQLLQQQADRENTISLLFKNCWGDIVVFLFYCLDGDTTSRPQNILVKWKLRMNDLPRNLISIEKGGKLDEDNGVEMSFHISTKTSFEWNSKKDFFKIFSIVGEIFEEILCGKLSMQRACSHFWMEGYFSSEAILYRAIGRFYW